MTREFFTPRHVRIPHLKDKIELLYRHHPFIRKQYEFAKELGVSPATLSTWIVGVSSPDGVTVNPSTVPAKHFSAFGKIFGVPGPVLEMEDFIEFKATFESGRGAWEKLVRALPNDETIEIILNSDRRIVDPDEDEEDSGLMRVRDGDEIRLHVPNPGLRHGVLLQQDREGWSTLRPTARWKETETDDMLVYPRPRPDGAPRFARVEGSGVHLMLAIFTREPLPSKIIDILLAKDLYGNGLDQSVSVFHNLLADGPDKCRMFSRRFLVTSAPRQQSQMRPESPA